ncbi:MAG: glycine betaine ABC transporter substrate-binding protein [Burkholderiales bacterium]
MRLRLLVLLFLLPAWCLAQPAFNIGSKRFTESYILGEIVTQAAAAAGEARAVHRQGLGNTGIVFAALESGAIDAYPEYTGTVVFELLKRKASADLAELNHLLAPRGLGVAVPFGFNNTYALAMREERAAALGVAKLSDLARHPAIRLGLSQEFLNRADGWPALRRAYELPLAAPRGLDHGLAYEALASGQVDVIDIYSTDAKIGKYRLRVLVDDRGFFPAYEALLLYRLDVPHRFPRSWAALQHLQGRISASRMIAMNGEVELAGNSFAEVARRFLAARENPAAATGNNRKSFPAILFGEDLGRLTLQHLLLVFASLALSAMMGIPLGIWAANSPRAAHWILATVGTLQTVPSLALLAFLITLMGTIGTVPAIIALFLYALLPIVRNTHSGLTDIAAPLRQAAQALGLPAAARLRLIELPLAARSIFAGVKTSAVINVGSATIAAFIGAGGYGERIVAGLAVNDNAMLLAGAVPAAVLALLVQWAFDALERRVIPRGLRGERRGGEVT